MTTEKQPPPSAHVSPSLLFPFFNVRNRRLIRLRRNHSFFENIFVDVVNLERRSMLRVNRNIHACMAPLPIEETLKTKPIFIFYIFPKKKSRQGEPGKKASFSP